MCYVVPHCRYDQLLPFLDSNPDCLNAARHLICASWFPKCVREEVDFPEVTVRDVCRSTCLNYFKACRQNPGRACDGFVGAGPNDPRCTGAATSAHPNKLVWMMASLTTVVALVLALTNIL